MLSKELVKAVDVSLREQWYQFEDKIRRALGFASNVIEQPAILQQPCLIDTFDDYLIVEMKQRMFKVPYTMTAEKVEFDWENAIEVQQLTVYEPLEKRDKVSKPETTENYVRIPVNSCDITATIDISEKDGIKALYCGNEKQIATYLFDKDKWDMDKAKDWVKEHSGKKSTETKKVEKSYIIPIKKVNEEKHLIYGIVLEPDTEDAQGDAETIDEIEKAAHKFLKDSRIIFKEHEARQESCYVVESYIAPVDFEGVKKGSWVMVTYCGDDDVWKQVKEGELTGYSIRGYANRN